MRAYQIWLVRKEGRSAFSSRYHGVEILVFSSLYHLRVDRIRIGQVDTNLWNGNMERVFVDDAALLVCMALQGLLILYQMNVFLRQHGI
jgi:hypothetical protein